MRYSEMDKQALAKELERARSDYETLRGHKLNLNLTRGKPETAQLALSDGMFCYRIGRQLRFRWHRRAQLRRACGTPACRKLFSEILLCKPEEVICGGNAS
jgi:hypothetical protein